MLVNQVTSAEIDSKIFNDLFERMHNSCPNDIQLVNSIKPQLNSDIFHYHRPHLETNLQKNSLCTVHHDLNDNDIWHDFSKFEPRYKEAKTIICLNSQQKEFLFNKGIKNTVVIPHGVDKKIFNDNSQEKTTSKKIRIGIFSKNYGRKVKGEAYLKDLSKRIYKENFSFLLVGENRQETAFELINLGFEVNFYERLPYRLFSELYKNIDILLITSQFEGGPANLPEAIASATPIISSKVGMCMDFVEDGFNGFFLTGDFYKDIKIFNRIINLKELETIKKGAKLASSRALSWEQVNSLIFSEYRKIVNKK